jgi:hypothetical protein
VQTEDIHLDDRRLAVVDDVVERHDRAVQMSSRSIGVEKASLRTPRLVALIRSASCSSARTFWLIDNVAGLHELDQQASGLCGVRALLGEHAEEVGNGREDALVQTAEDRLVGFSLIGHPWFISSVSGWPSMILARA